MKSFHISGRNSGKTVEWQARVRSFFIYILVGAVLFGVLAGSRSTTESLERAALSYNILASEKSPEDGEKVVIIMCTDNTIDQLSHQSGWPIDRSYYAALLKTALAGADTVVFDMLFTDETRTKSDAEFAEAVKEHGSVVLGRSIAAYPIDALLDAGARVGFALEFAENKSDAISRSYKLYVNEDLCTGPTIICATLLQRGYSVEFNGKNTYTIISPQGEVRKLSVDDEGYFYRIPVMQRRDIEIFDLYDVYTGNYPAGAFDGAVVFIGGSVAGFEDIVHAPDFTVDENGDATGGTSMRVMGTKFLADSYLTALRGFSPQRVSVAAETILCILLFLAAAFAAIRFPFKLNWLIELAGCAAWFGITRLLFVTGLCYIGVIAPICCIVLAYLLVLVLHLFMASREWLVSSMPTEALYRMAYELDSVDSFDGFGDFVSGFSDDIFNRIGASVVFAQTDASNELFRSVEPPAANGGRAADGTKVVRSGSVSKNYGVHSLVIIPLPIIGGEEQTYTVLGTSKKVSANWNQSVTALVLAMYVYYNAQKESREKQEMALSMITMIIQMIDAKDPVTAGHSRRVSQFSRQLAEWLGYDRKAAEDVEFAALLHDIGKIGVEDTILNKPGIFTDADFAQMKLHPVRGAEIVRTVGLSPEIIDGVLHHHERLDGRGYPDGVTGDKLTDYAKIIKVADVYDALTSQRQYKSAWGARRALDMISRGMGTEFDEHIARTFIENTAPDYSSEESVQGGYGEATIDKSVAFAQLLWDSASTPVMTKRNTMSRLNTKFDFCCVKRFAGIEWGERFGTSVILKNLPSILHYDNETDSTIIALRGPREGIVNNIICYFRKGCLSAGIVTLRPETAGEAVKELDRIYGASEIHSGVPVWTSRDHLAIGMKSDGNNMIAYVTGYLSNEI